MKKLIIFIYCLMLYVCFGCEPALDCDGSNRSKTWCEITKTTKIKGFLSNASTVHHVGDTLRFYARIPDTLYVRLLRDELNPNIDTNQIETVYVKSLWSKETNNAGVRMQSGDSINYYSGALWMKDTNKTPTFLAMHKVKFATLNFNGDGGWQYINLTRDTRELECYFVITQKGFHIFGGGISRVAVVDRDDKVWVIEARFRYFDKEGKPAIIRPEMILDRVDPASRVRLVKYRTSKLGEYFFEVK